MNMFARFDENPAITLQYIKETKRYGWTHGRTDGRTWKQFTPPQTKFAGGIKKDTTNYYLPLGRADISLVSVSEQGEPTYHSSILPQTSWSNSSSVRHDPASNDRYITINNDYKIQQEKTWLCFKRITKAQTSLHTHAVWSVSLLFTF